MSEVSTTPISDRIRFRSKLARVAAVSQELGGDRACTIADLQRFYGADAAKAAAVTDHTYDQLRAHGWPGRPKVPRVRGAHGRFVTPESPPATDAAGEDAGPMPGLRNLGGLIAEGWAELPPATRARIVAGLGSDDGDKVADAWTEALRRPADSLVDGVRQVTNAPPSAWQLQSLSLLYERGRTIQAGIHYQHREPLAPPAPVELDPRPGPEPGDDASMPAARRIAGQ